MPTIYEWPLNWYRFTKGTFRLQARSQATPRTWIGGKSVYGPHSQLWVAQLSVVISRQDDDDAQAMAAFFSRLDGQAGLLRIGDPFRTQLQYNREIEASSSFFTDSSGFTDGTGFTENLQPDSGYLTASANRGDNFLEMAGLLEMSLRAIRRGDLLEVRPNGIATEVPNLYEVQVDGHTGTGGITGVEVRPRLRQDFANGDQVIFRNAMSVFRVVDDDQGAAEVDIARHYSMGFSLVEAII